SKRHPRGSGDHSKRHPRASGDPCYTNRTWVPASAGRTGFRGDDCVLRAVHCSPPSAFSCRRGSLLLSTLSLFHWPMTDTALLVLTALVLGAMHSFAPDHLAAVSVFVSRKPSWR